MSLIIESPISMLEGEVITYSITWEGASVLANPSAVVKMDDVNITRDVMLGGENLIRENVQQLKPLTARKAGDRYKVYVHCVVDGTPKNRHFIVDVMEN